MFQVDQIGGLSTNKAWNSIDQAQFLAHFEAFVKCTDITKIAIRNNDPIGDFPIELLQNLNCSSLLPFDPQVVQRIRQVNWQFGCDFFYKLHAIVEIGVDAQHKCTVCNGLDQLHY